MAGECHARQGGQLRDQRVAQRGQARPLVPRALRSLRQLQGPRKANGSRPRSPSPPVAAAPGSRRTAGPAAAVPCRTNRAPTPLGPFSLWPDRLSRSAPQRIHVQRQKARRLHRVDMEQRTTAGGRWHRSRRIGCTVPTSLLAYITLTSVVCSPMADATSAGSTRPYRSTGELGHSNPYRSMTAHRRAVTALCSMLLVDQLAAARAGRPGSPLDGQVVGLCPAAGEHDLARLGAQGRATVSRASSRPSRARRPMPWMLDGLPKCSVRYGCIASSTSGRRGVVAAWSR